MRARLVVCATVLFVHPGLLSPRRERPRSRGAALLLTVLVVLAAATITAVLVQVAVNSAAAQKRRLSHDSAVSLAASVERRVANALSQDPLRVFSEVLPDEPPRVCSGDLATYPTAFSAGSDWPASCGASWSYLGTGNLSRGARVFPPSPGSPVWRVEVFAQVGIERVGFTREFLAGGRGRPMLYSGGDLLDASLGASFEVAGPVYAVGQVDLSAASVSDGVVVASEEAVLGSSGGLEAGPAGADDGGVVVRDVFASPVPASTLVSSSGELARVGCLDISPANVEGFSTGLCLRAGRTLVTSGGASVVFPADGSYAAVLVVPVGDGQVRVYTRADLPVEWPGVLAEWTEVGVFFLPAHGLVVTDAATVLGHCDEVAGVCRDWDGGGAPGALVDSSFTLVVGTPDDPADLRFGGPVSAGEGRVGVLVSGSVRVPVGASPSGTGLEVDAWVAALGRPGEVVLASEGTGVRPTFVLNGALLLGEFTFDLSGFPVSSVSVPERSSVAPPFFPAPGLLFLPDRALRTGSSVLDALFAAGEASGFSLPSAPGLLSAVPGDGSVTLSWSAPLDDGGVTLLDYVVEYRESAASSWSTAADLVSTDLQASVSGLVNGTGYEFRVAAVNGVGQGPFSGTLTASPFVVPFAPTGLTVSAVPEVESRLDLAWNAVTNTPISGYNVYRLNQVSGLFELVASSATTSFSDSGLSAGTEYSYKVAAFTSAGEGVRSAAVSATTTNPSPLVPTISSSSRGNLTVTLSFSSSTTLERPVDGFRFYVDGVEVAASSDPSLTSYTFGGLTSGVASVFGVAAFNASGLSSLATVTVTAISTPNAPSDLVAAPEPGVPGSLMLSWTAPTNETPDGFYVYRKNDVTDIYEVIATVTAPSHVDDALDVGVLYAYRVSAFVASLEGGLSGVVTATPIDVPLDAVVLGSALGDLSVTLTFVVDETDGRPVDGYRLLLDGVEVADIPSPVSEYEFTGLVEGFTYEFSVLAYNAVGEGASDSVLLTAYSLPVQVTGLSVVAVPGSGSSLALSWDEPPGLFDGFFVYRLDPLSGLYEVVASSSSVSLVDSGLLPGVSYSYRVAAFNAAGTGGLSTAVAGTPNVVPGAPTITAITAGNQQLSVAFTAGSNNGTAITTYSYSTDGGSSWRARATGTTASPLVITTISGAGNTALVSGTSYQVQIRAVNAAGDGAASASTSGTPAPLSLSYASTAFSTSQTSQTRGPTVSGGTASSFSFSGTLPTGVSFDTATGVFTGPSAWNFTATQVSTGSTHSCAVTDAGEVRCWGSGSSGKLGNGLTENSSTPVTVRTSSSNSSPLTGVTQVASGSAHTCALLESGQVRCWGSGDIKKTNGCSATTTSWPIVVYESCSPLTVLTDVTFLSAGLGYTCALLGSGQVHCWGDVGSAWSGALVNGKVPTSAADSSPLSGVVHIATGGSTTNQGTFACAVLSSGEVRCWGANTYGYLGNNSTTASSTPVVVQMSASDSGPLTGAAQVVAGNNHVCALLSSGEVRCWGLGSYGRLGDGSSANSSTPVKVRTSSSASSPLSGVASLTSYRYHTCAVLSSGGVKCWGYNAYGQLGDGTTTNRSTPVDVAGLTSGVASISAGSSHTCAVLSSGGVKCWGLNSSDQLGDGTTTNRSTPVDVSGTGPDSGWPAAITVTVTASGGATANANVTLTNS